MTYESSEISVASGRPVELYDISMGLIHWRITSSSEDQEYFANTYEHAICKCSELEQTGELPKDGLELELPRGHPLGTICAAGSPEEEVELNMYRGHGVFFQRHFTGFLTNFKFDKDAIPIFYFEPRSSDMPFIGGRRRCTRLCEHKFCGYRCGLNKEAYKVTGTIDTISGLTITATELNGAYPLNYGGEIVVGSARRTIYWHSGIKIKITKAFRSDVVAGSAFSAYAGCNHKSAMCNTTYGNILNYGGQLGLPRKNIYTGELLY